jgi:hypothetical protein
MSGYAQYFAETRLSHWKLILNTTSGTQTAVAGCDLGGRVWVHIEAVEISSLRFVCNTEPRPLDIVGRG